MRFLEAMNARYENHPYFTAQLAIRMEALGATAISARLLRQVFTCPLSRTPSDDHFRPKSPWDASVSKTSFLTKTWNDTQMQPKTNTRPNTSNPLRVGHSFDEIRGSLTPDQRLDPQ